MTGIPLAIGEVLEVFHREGRSIFLNVGLRHFRAEDGSEDGVPLEARVRWATGYAGTTPDSPYGEPGGPFGDWHIPEVGSDVLCFFPAVSPTGQLGDDLGNGYAFAYWPNSVEPPIVDGIAGPLSASRRVYKGRAGEAEDRHIKGDQDHQVDGNRTTLVKGAEFQTVNGPQYRTLKGGETKTTTFTATHNYLGSFLQYISGGQTTTVAGNRAVTVNGIETRETKNLHTWTFRAAMSLLGDLAMTIKSLTTLILQGVVQVKILSAGEILLQVGNSKIEITTSGIVFTGATLTHNGISILDGTVYLGGISGAVGVARIGDDVDDGSDTIESGSTIVFSK